MVEVHVQVVSPRPGLYAGYCSGHGMLQMVWASPLGAAFDALGHAAHHHRSPDRATLP